VFTGIIEEIGMVERVDHSGRAPLVIRCGTVLDGTRIGDSIAVNGVCLTVAELSEVAFRADVQPVTLRRSNLGDLRAGDRVNLERSLAVGQRMGGHYVQGHVDGIGRVVNTVGDGPSVVVRVAVPEALLRYVVERGFVTVDGASLTVMRVHSDGFDVSLVYHTQQTITLPSKRPGSAVNIEADVIGKYVERLLSPAQKDGVTLDLLHRAGFLS
jgi:riboflavin synthase